MAGPFPQTPRNFRITLRVISAQQLPKPQGKTKGEIIDPFCEVVVKGVPQDCKTVRTATVEDNGINPLWDEMFDMPLKCVHLAHLLFKVKDGESALRSDRSIGFCSVPAMTLREGYRMLPIYSNETARPLEFASLFVHIAFSHARAELLTPAEVEMENRPFQEAAEAAATRTAAAAAGGSPHTGNPHRKVQSEASLRVTSACGALTRTGSDSLPSAAHAMLGAALSSSEDDEAHDMYPKTIRVWPLYALGLSRQADGPATLPDPFVVLFLDDKEVGKTSTIKNSAAPVWSGEYFDMALPVGLRPRDDCHLRLEVYDYDMFSQNEFLGEVVLDAEVLAKGNKSASQFMLRPKVGKSSKYVQGSLSVAITDTTVSTLSADKTRSFASRRDHSDALEEDRGMGGLLDSVVSVVGDGISSIGSAMRSAVFGEDPQHASQAAGHPEHPNRAVPYNVARDDVAGMGLTQCAPKCGTVKSFEVLQRVAQECVDSVFVAAGVHVDQAQNAAALAARAVVPSALPAPEHRLAPQECFRLHAPLLENGAAMPEEVWLELKEAGVMVVHRVSTGDTLLTVWPWGKIRKCVGKLQDSDPDVSSASPFHAVCLPDCLLACLPDCRAPSSSSSSSSFSFVTHECYALTFWCASYADHGDADGDRRG